uniref:Uncharacterized protein n=1 Tax=Cacopsylla melanoneura TaxID=428564 RepID=A0A8D9A2H1_9HEMI
MLIVPTHPKQKALHPMSPLEEPEVSTLMKNSYAAIWNSGPKSKPVTPVLVSLIPHHPRQRPLTPLTLTPPPVPLHSRRDLCGGEVRRLLKKILAELVSTLQQQSTPHRTLGLRLRRPPRVRRTPSPLPSEDHLCLLCETKRVKLSGKHTPSE